MVIRMRPIVIYLGVMPCAAILAVSEAVHPMSAQQADLPPTARIEVTVSVPAVVYSGVPCIAEILVQNNIPKVARLSKEEILAMEEKQRGEYFQRQILSNLRIPEYSLLSNQPPPFSVEIVDHTGKTVVPPNRPGLLAFFTMNADLLNPGDGLPISQMRFIRPHFSVRSGQQGSLIVDLQPWTQSLKPGEYRLTVTMYPGGMSAAGRGGTVSWKSEPVEFRIKRLGGALGRAIRRAFPAVTADRPDEPDWFKSLEPWEKPYSWGGGYTEPRRFGWLRPAVDLQHLRDEVPDEVWTSLAVYSFLSRSIKVEPDAEPPLELLESLPDYLQGFTGMLLYESLLGKGDGAEAAKLRARLIGKRPDLRWQLDRAKQGDGLIQLAKRRAAKNQPENDQDDPDKP